MAICEDCKHEMTSGASCTVAQLHRAGEPVPLPAHRGRRRCGDCGVQPGGYHHLGCDLQRCPACGDQLICCGCGWDELGGDEAWDDDDEPSPEVLAAVLEFARSRGEAALPQFPPRGTVPP